MTLALINLVRLLESCGCKKVYQSDKPSEGFQTLLYEGNSGTILSVEMIGGKAEIRTNNKQEFYFPTKEIMDNIATGVPLFSNYKVSDWLELPLVPFVELLRLEHLESARIDSGDSYYAVGLSGTGQEQHELDIDKIESTNRKMEISRKRMELFPDRIQAYYDYTEAFIKGDVFALPKHR